MSMKKQIWLDMFLNIAQFTTATQAINTKLGVMQKGMRMLGGVMAGLFAGQMILGGLKRLIGTIATFERSMDRVRAVVGDVTQKEFDALEGKARQLGMATRFTATEVAQLENELAKLGFKTPEILKLTKAVLNLASIAETGLGEAAQVVGSTIRAFNMTASESGHVVNVMAKAFTSSALTMEKFKVAMSIVAPIALKTGLSIEQTTAMLGLLVDRGIDASMAGTGLRGILLDLSRHGISLAEAFDLIQNSTDKNATAFDLFGKRGAAVSLTLAGVEGAIGTMTEKLIDSQGAAQEMSDIIEDNLIGAGFELKSAWEALTLEGGVLLPMLESFIRMLTRILRLFNQVEAHRADILGFDKEEVEAEIELLKELKNAKTLEVISARKKEDGLGSNFAKGLLGGKSPAGLLKEEADELDKTYQIALDRLREINDLAKLIEDRQKNQKSLDKIGGSGEGGDAFNFLPPALSGPISPEQLFLDWTEANEKLAASIAKTNAEVLTLMDSMPLLEEEIEDISKGIEKMEIVGLALETTMNTVIDGLINGFDNLGDVIRSVLANIAKELLTIGLLKAIITGNPINIGKTFAGLGIIAALAATSKTENKLRGQDIVGAVNSTNRVGTNIGVVGGGGLGG